MKRLSEKTIVPNDFYVLREADRQLAANLADMQRPAYILVARQMGKTNLLLNAKRTLESPTDRFVYIDLSTVFSDERDCFRSMIDTALDAHVDLFGGVGAEILKLRSDDRSASKEHASELRILLKRTPGKLVFILDEIDSLTSANYSDRVFAHIRSVYFSRTNYPELAKLTYVLSGVVEPSEIIKNKEISPFNIGEKIYLDDFTEQESLDFLNRAELKLSADCFARLRYWVGGHPRMTWDTCSKVEDQILNEGQTTVEKIDALMRDLYLNAFDIPPVDHIRQLVSENSDICTAVWEIAKGSSSRISDKVRTRLYLNGVTRASNIGQNLDFKNRVIAEALSVPWLEQLLSEQTGKLVLARRNFERGLYREAVTLYTEALSSGILDRSSSVFAELEIGRCLYRIDEFQEALAYIEKSLDRGGEESQLRPLGLLSKGLCLSALKDYSGSIEAFTECCEKFPKADTYVHSLVNIGLTHRYRGQPDDLAIARDTFARVADDTQVSGGQNIERAERNSRLALGKYELGKTLVAMGEVKDAQVAFAEGLELGDNCQQVLVTLELIPLMADSVERRKLAVEAAQKVIDDSLAPKNADRFQAMPFTQDKALHLLSQLAELDAMDEWEKVTYFLVDNYAKESTRALHLTARASIYSFNITKTRTAGEKMLLAAEKWCEDAEDARTRYLWLFYITGWQKYGDQYLEHFERTPPEEIGRLDLRALNWVLNELIEKGEYGRTLALTGKIRERCNLKANGGLVGIEFLEMVANWRSGQSDRAAATAREILRNLEDDKTIQEEITAWGEQDVEALKDHARALVFAHEGRVSVTKPIIKTDEQFGRNDWIVVKYSDGRIVTDKFKRVSGDLQAGRCVFLSRAPKK